MAGKLKLHRNFTPCPSEPGDELYPNGIFVFNVTRLIAHIEAHLERFPRELVPLTEIPNYGGDEDLDAEGVRTANLARPILFAEIAPARYNLIDGHHRVARARQECVPALPAYRVHCPEHIPFLTTARACEAYVEYWNEKLRER